MEITQNFSCLAVSKNKKMKWCHPVLLYYRWGTNPSWTLCFSALCSPCLHPHQLLWPHYQLLCGQYFSKAGVKAKDRQVSKHFSFASSGLQNSEDALTFPLGLLCFLLESGMSFKFPTVSLSKFSWMFLMIWPDVFVVDHTVLFTFWTRQLIKA